MSSDLAAILRGWEYSPDNQGANVRVVAGEDGREKIQMRIKCGLIQWEKEGRPDGKRPHGFDSMLEFCAHLLRKHRSTGGRDDDFSLSEEVTGEVREEIMDYYHRRTVRFQLADYGGAKSDADHNLRLMAYVKRFVDDPEIVMSHERYRPFVLMDLTRASAMVLVEGGEPPQALSDIDEGMAAIQDFYREYDRDDLIEDSQELRVLRTLKEDIRQQFGLPFSKREIMESLEQDLADAVEQEDYERAGEIKKQIDELALSLESDAP